ncbi:MAG: heavy-metal-associated domain-containing protein [Pirellulales bacterium]|nr:heavy-metal-associated domain-containing protein [Pirellulales bacterium]
MLSSDLTRPTLRAAALVAVVLAVAAQGQLASAATAATATYEITADDMCCAGCAKKIAGQLYTAPGVMKVTSNVKARTVVVTAKPSPKLTVERLWNAVEKGKGKPSRIVTSGVTYSLKRPADLSPAEQPAAGVYTLSIADLQPAAADSAAKSLQAVRGVVSVSIDAANGALIVEPARGVVLSPWALIGAAQQAKVQPLAVSGPHGRLTIAAAAADAQLSARPVSQGANR